MSSTHAAMGLAVVSLFADTMPEYAWVAAVAAIAGGIFPDLDVLFEHRKTLHHPEIYPIATVIATAIAVSQPAVETVSLAVFLGAAALHSLSDVFGGGLGLRPWENDDQRGIYLHFADRWLPAKEWVRYDGAPEDLVLVILFSIPPVLAYDGIIRTAIAVGIAGSAVYVLLRKRLDEIFEIVVRDPQ